MSDPAVGGRLPLVQFSASPDVLDLGWGHPDPDLLPVDDLRRAADDAARRWGPDLLAYGYAQGPGPLIEWLAGRLADVDARAPELASLVITAGASNALDLVVTLSTRPGDVALVESPTYHIAVKLLRDHRLELRPVPRDRRGPDPAALAAALDQLAEERRRASLLYLVPTFHNPTGGVVPIDRRRELVALAAERDLLLLEDDAYRELSYDDAPPPSLWSLAPPGVVVRVGSFSKTLAPGLRLGYLTGAPALTARLVDSGLLDSGGGIAHYPGLIVAGMGETGYYADHVEALRTAYRERRDALAAAIAALEESGARIAVPGGGFFIYVTLPEGRSAAALLDGAIRDGVSFMPGTAFSVDGGGEHALRLSFSRYGPEQLEEAGRRLVRAVTEVG